MIIFTIFYYYFFDQVFFVVFVFFLLIFKCSYFCCCCCIVLVIDFDGLPLMFAPGHKCLYTLILSSACFGFFVWFSFLIVIKFPEFSRRIAQKIWTMFRTSFLFYSLRLILSLSFPSFYLVYFFLSSIWTVSVL